MKRTCTKKVLASLLSILIGLVVGSVIIAVVGLSTNPELGASSAWDGIRIVFAGLFSTGRTAAGVLTWGFNSTNFGQYALPRHAADYDGPVRRRGVQDRPVQHRRARPVPHGHARVA